jgi:hypothetical protein
MKFSQWLQEDEQFDLDSFIGDKDITTVDKKTINGKQVKDLLRSSYPNLKEEDMYLFVLPCIYHVPLHQWKRFFVSDTPTKLEVLGDNGVNLREPMYDRLKDQMPKQNRDEQIFAHARAKMDELIDAISKFLTYVNLNNRQTQNIMGLTGIIKLSPSVQNKIDVLVKMFDPIENLANQLDSKHFGRGSTSTSKELFNDPAWKPFNDFIFSVANHKKTELYVNQLFKELNKDNSTLQRQLGKIFQRVKQSVEKIFSGMYQVMKDLQKDMEDDDQGEYGMGGDWWKQ